MESFWSVHVTTNTWLVFCVSRRSDCPARIHKEDILYVYNFPHHSPELMWLQTVEYLFFSLCLLSKK